jgi:hypothetical protein
MKAECNTFGSNLEADDLATWTEVDAETPVVQHLRGEALTAFVKNGKTTDKLGVSDTGRDSENNCDDSMEQWYQN